MYIKKQNGFSITEVLIAMFILLIGVVGAISLTAKNVKTLGTSRDIVVATLLAQEGIELVRSMRDNNVTEFSCNDSGNETSSGTQKCAAFSDVYGFRNVKATNACTVDAKTSTKLNCSGGDDELLLVENTAGVYYTHDKTATSVSSSIPDRNYRRRIYISYFNKVGGVTAQKHDIAFACVTSIVISGKTTWGNVGAAGNPHNSQKDCNADFMRKNCTKEKGCAYAQTKLTSWINYT